MSTNLTVGGIGYVSYGIMWGAWWVGRLGSRLVWNDIFTCGSTLRSDTRALLESLMGYPPLELVLVPPGVVALQSSVVALLEGRPCWKYHLYFLGFPSTCPLTPWLGWWRLYWGGHVWYHMPHVLLLPLMKILVIKGLHGITLWCRRISIFLSLGCRMLGSINVASSD